MSEPMITCPNCKHEIKLTESLAEPLIAATRAEFNDLMARKEAEVGDRLEALESERQKVAEQARELDAAVATKVDAARQQIANDEAARARAFVAQEIAERDRSLGDLRLMLEQREAKLAEAQQAQADMLRKQREFEDAKRELDLTVEKRVNESLADVRARAKLEAEEGLQLRVREKEEQIASMQRQIEDLKRKAEQGSQQLQGEVQELELEELLRAQFPRDQIDPVPKGEFGGDLIQRVFNAAGQPCGTILWEAKRTRNWSDGWLSKLRENQRAINADFALIISHALPKGMTSSFDLVESVWVAEPRCAVPIAVALRESVIALARERQASEGQQTKMELVYRYLTGPRFRQRIEAIVEKFTDMQEDLERERRTMTKAWARREEQIRGVVASTAGMYGDLQGIAGRTLQEIDGLEMTLIGGPDPEPAESIP